MSRRESLESVLNQAKEKEKKYDWLEAAEIHKMALQLARKEGYSKMGEIQERIGYCFHRAAFQAETQEEFKKHMDSSVKAYEEGAKFYERSVHSKDAPAHTSHLKAKASHSKFWVAKAPSERKVLLKTCQKSVKEALKTYNKTGNLLGYGKAVNTLLECFEERYFFARDWQEMKSQGEEAIEYSEKAVEVFSKSEYTDEYELTRTYCWFGGWVGSMTAFVESIEKQTEGMQKSLEYAHKALEISEKTGDSYLIGISNRAVGHAIMVLTGDFEKSLKHAEKMLEMGNRTRDNLLKAWACESLTYFGFWKTTMEEDPEKRRIGFNKAIQRAKDAITYYKLLCYAFHQSYYFHLDCCFELANDSTNPKKKRILLERTAEVGRKYLEQVKAADSPTMIYSFLHSLSKVLLLLSAMKINKSERIELLREASKYREENVDLDTRLTPFFYWNRGVTFNYLALTEAELAKIEPNNKEKEGLLRKAVVNMENCLSFCQKEVKARPQPLLMGALGDYHDQFGSILNQLYSLTHERRFLERAIEIYEAAVQAWGKADLHGRMAEGHWQVAKFYDHLREHSKAVVKFESASAEYTLIAEKIPNLKEFYIDHAVYMQAWSEIEKAKHHHSEKRYGQAKEHYKTTSDLHKSTKRWKYLSTNYLAWAQLEAAEDQSREDQPKEAKTLFQEAAATFVKASESIKAKLDEIETEEEKKLASELIKASDTRREYCLGRNVLEEAKLLDRKGEHLASSKKYGLAAETFTRIGKTEPKQSRIELLPITYLSQAWQEMMMAEAKASSNMYGKAAELFRLAQEHALDERTGQLALANSSFCKALQAGTEFETTRDMSAYSTAKNHMEAAATFYAKAGFGDASEYAKATRRLFDAYTYMHQAEVEPEPEKKAQFYRMTEKLLQASVKSFNKAKHAEKSRQVERLLETVKEERQLAVSLVEVLQHPTATLTTASFSMPNPTYEQAVGLEMFEHAQIQANLIVQKGEVNVGEDVALEIEMVNAGKGVATLVKVEDFIPIAEFKVVDKPEMYRFEDSYLNMRGKRLDPLKTEDVKVVAKPQAKGTFTMKPRILYIDDAGKYKSHEPEPVTITIKELGIKDWIKGEG